KVSGTAGPPQDRTTDVHHGGRAETSQTRSAAALAYIALFGSAGRPRSWCRPSPAAAGPRHSTSAPVAQRVRGFRHDAERVHMAETGSEAHELFPRFSQERSAAIVPALGLLYIGGAAYFVWAYPPNGGCTARRHVAVHRHTTSALTTSKQLLVT